MMLKPALKDLQMRRPIFILHESETCFKAMNGWFVRA